MARSLLILLLLISAATGCSSAYRSHLLSVGAVGVPADLEEPVADARYGLGLLNRPHSAPPCPYYDYQRKMWRTHPPILAPCGCGPETMHMSSVPSQEASSGQKAPAATPASQE